MRQGAVQQGEATAGGGSGGSGNHCNGLGLTACRAEFVEWLTMGFWMATNADC